MSRSGTRGRIDALEALRRALWRAQSLLREALSAFRQRFKAAPDDASKLITVGDSPVDMSIDAPELASWTMMASSIFNLYRTTTQE